MPPKPYSAAYSSEGRSPKLIRCLIEECLSDTETPRQELLGVGVGVVGPLDRKTGTILRPLHFTASGWIDVPIKNMVEDAVGIPATVDNGAN